MEQKTPRNPETDQQEAHRAEEQAPPSVLGDVEDAVTPHAEGELTPWMPPDQPEGGDDVEG